MCVKYLKKIVKVDWFWGAYGFFHVFWVIFHHFLPLADRHKLTFCKCISLSRIKMKFVGNIGNVVGNSPHDLGQDQGVAVVTFMELC